MAIIKNIGTIALKDIIRLSKVPLLIFPGYANRFTQIYFLHSLLFLSLIHILRASASISQKRTPGRMSFSAFSLASRTRSCTVSYTHLSFHNTDTVGKCLRFLHVVGSQDNGDPALQCADHIP